MAAEIDVANPTGVIYMFTKCHLEILEFYFRKTDVRTVDAEIYGPNLIGERNMGPDLLRTNNI